MPLRGGGRAVCRCAGTAGMWGMGVLLLVGRWSRLLLVLVLVLELVLHWRVRLVAHVLGPWLPGLNMLLRALQLLAVPRCCPMMGSSRRRVLKGKLLTLCLWRGLEA